MPPIPIGTLHNRLLSTLPKETLESAERLILSSTENDMYLQQPQSSPFVQSTPNTPFLSFSSSSSSPFVHHPHQILSPHQQPLLQQQPLQHQQIAQPPLPQQQSLSQQQLPQQQLPQQQQLPHQSLSQQPLLKPQQLSQQKVSQQPIEQRPSLPQHSTSYHSYTTSSLNIINETNDNNNMSQQSQSLPPSRVSSPEFRPPSPPLPAKKDCLMRRGPISGSPAEGKAPICSNCNTTTTPLWRRSVDDELLCNACGL
ncbi:hypothetical protein G6F22_013542 [Rhizopus arrhizus]|nr:hypothetical protein G6F22_013542 [Rhizopus arrhizus]